MKFIVIVFAALLATSASIAEINAVTSTTDLAYFVQEVGGECVTVSSIASPLSDVHFVEVRPSYMSKVAKADVVFRVGLELDTWMDRIVDGSRNGKLVIVDCSRHIAPLDVPAFKVDASHGELHRFGNPHYWLGPKNVAPIVEAVVEGLSSSDPPHAAEFEANGSNLMASIEAHLERIRTEAEPLRGKEAVFYHDSWPYLNEFTGMRATSFIEPFPGVPPTASQVKKVIEDVRGRGIKVIAVEPYFDLRVPDKIASETGAKVITLYPSIGGRKENETYIEWLEGNIKALVEGMK
jgi:zinc/manganese transport system substrate-binding protein